MFFILETLLQFVIGIIEIFLVLRFLFKLFAANTGTPFVQWLYQTTEPLLNPFRNIFPTTQVDGRYLVEFTTLTAIVVYLLFAYLAIALIDVVRVRGGRY